MRRRVLDELDLLLTARWSNLLGKSDAADSRAAKQPATSSSEKTIQIKPATETPPDSAIASADLAALEKMVAGCRSCGLCGSRTRTAFARGNPNAKIVLVGEGPGEQEDQQGLPFVGPAGKLLDNMLAGIGIGAEDIYIANVIKCRPPDNRNPSAAEQRTCLPYLRRQLELVKPDLIVTAGKIASNALLECDDTMGDMRKRSHQYNGIPLVAIYHPAYLLRSLKEKSKAWDDLLRIKAAMPG